MTTRRNSHGKQGVFPDRFANCRGAPRVSPGTSVARFRPRGQADDPAPGGARPLRTRRRRVRATATDAARALPRARHREPLRSRASAAIPRHDRPLPFGDPPCGTLRVASALPPGTAHPRRPGASARSARWCCADRRRGARRGRARPAHDRAPRRPTATRAGACGARAAACASPNRQPRGAARRINRAGRGRRPGLRRRGPRRRAHSPTSALRRTLGTRAARRRPSRTRAAGAPDRAAAMRDVRRDAQQAVAPRLPRDGAARGRRRATLAACVDAPARCPSRADGSDDGSGSGSGVRLAAPARAPGSGSETSVARPTAASATTTRLRRRRRRGLMGGLAGCARDDDAPALLPRMVPAASRRVGRIATTGARDADACTRGDDALALIGYVATARARSRAPSSSRAWRRRGPTRSPTLAGEFALAVARGRRTWSRAIASARGRCTSRRCPAAPSRSRRRCACLLAAGARRDDRRATRSCAASSSATCRRRSTALARRPSSSAPGEWLAARAARRRRAATTARASASRAAAASAAAARALDRALDARRGRRAAARRAASARSSRAGSTRRSCWRACTAGAAGRGVHAALRRPRARRDALRAAVATHLGVPHHVLELDARRFCDAHRAGARTSSRTCSPSPSRSRTSCSRAQAARRVDVLFTGEGGDPSFGGPKNVGHGAGRRVRAAPRAVARRGLLHRAPPPLRRSRRALDAARPRARSIAAAAVRRASSRRIDPAAGARGDTFVGRLMAANLALKGGNNILVKVAKMVGAHDLALRSPLFAREVVDLALTIPPWQKLDGTDEKLVLKRVAARSLPRAVVERPKRGMAVPLSRWLRGALGELARDVLTERARPRARPVPLAATSSACSRRQDPPTELARSRARREAVARAGHRALPPRRSSARRGAAARRDGASHRSRGGARCARRPRVHPAQPVPRGPPARRRARRPAGFDAFAAGPLAGASARGRRRPAAAARRGRAARRLPREWDAYFPGGDPAGRSPRACVDLFVASGVLVQARLAVVCVDGTPAHGRARGCGAGCAPATARRSATCTTRRRCSIRSPSSRSRTLVGVLGAASRSPFVDLGLPPGGLRARATLPFCRRRRARPRARGRRRRRPSSPTRCAGSAALQPRDAVARAAARQGGKR